MWLLIGKPDGHKLSESLSSFMPWVAIGIPTNVSVLARRDRSFPRCTRRLELQRWRDDFRLTALALEWPST